MYCSLAVSAEIGKKKLNHNYSPQVSSRGEALWFSFTHSRTRTNKAVTMNYGYNELADANKSFPWHFKVV